MHWHKEIVNLFHLAHYFIFLHFRCNGNFPFYEDVIQFNGELPSPAAKILNN